MLLFIAVLLIYNFDLGWFWYACAGLAYGLHIYANSQWQQNLMARFEVLMTQQAKHIQEIQQQLNSAQSDIQKAHFQSSKLEQCIGGLDNKFDALTGDVHRLEYKI